MSRAEELYQASLEHMLANFPIVYGQKSTSGRILGMDEEPEAEEIPLWASEGYVREK